MLHYKSLTDKNTIKEKILQGPVNMTDLSIQSCKLHTKREMHDCRLSVGSTSNVQNKHISAHLDKLIWLICH